MLVVASGMGDGKSRLLHELVGLWSPLWRDEIVPKGLTKGLTDNAKKRFEFTDKEKKALFNVVELRVNFENGTCLRRDEIVATEDPKERKECVNKILLDRLLYPMLGSEKTKTDFETFQKNSNWDFTCDNLVTDVQQLFSEGNTKNVLVVLLIDGIHNLDEVGSKSYTYDESMQRVLLEVVSGLITRVPYRFVACSSTMPLSVEDAMTVSGMVTKTVVSPPVLTKLPTEIDNEVVRKYAPQFLTMFGDHPRSMELLLTNGGTTVKAVFESAVRGLTKRYNRASLLNEELTDLLRQSFSPCTDERRLVGKRSLADVMRGGLMRIREGRLAISPLYLMMLEQAATDAAKQDNPLHGWQPFGHESDGGFEKYVAWVRCLRSRVFTEKVALETLHHGMIWLSGVPKITVQSTPLALHEAVNQVSTASEKKACTSARSEKAGNWLVAVKDGPKGGIDPLSSCIVNAKTAPAGDVFCSVETATKPAVRFNEVYQAKAWLGGESLLKPSEVLKHADVSASKDDVYVLVTRKKVASDSLKALKDRETGVVKGVHVGVVCNENFNEYFGPFAGTFLHGMSAQ